ncbi:hypothetical protein BGZ67_007685 [Mortierella alpina]|nr:hypothetical protein BGZ67_007685 [Mortierella alpina]
MSRPVRAITNAVLCTLFPTLCTLDEFLEVQLDVQQALVYESDRAEFKDLLQCTLVADTMLELEEHLVVPTENERAGSRADTTAPHFTEMTREAISNQDKVVTRAIEQLYRRMRSVYEEQFNVLVAGSQGQGPIRSNSLTENRFPNTLQDFVRSSLWEILLQRIGDEAMLYLLTSTSMFVALPNNCYCQITGPAISEQDIANWPIYRPKQGIRKHSVDDEDDALSEALKRESSVRDESYAQDAEKTGTDNQRHKKKQKTGRNDRTLSPQEISFKMTVALYFKGYQNESTMLRQFLLAEYNTVKHDSTLSSHAVEIQLWRMFPKQHGVDNVLTRADRAYEPRKSRSTWRLRGMKSLVGEMLHLNSQCKFKLLLQQHCPVEAIDNSSKTDSAPLDALLGSSNSFEQVASLVESIVKHILPLGMFGTTENRNVVLRAMATFIRLRKYETLSLHYVLHGFKTSDCSWLQDGRLQENGSHVTHIPKTASKKQLEILHEFVYWLFEGFLIPLLKSAFYITDSSFQRNKICYYRHGLWQLISKHAMQTTKENMLIKMEPAEATSCTRPYAAIRFLPKENDLRPITNLSRKSPRTVNGMGSSNTNSVNRRLRNPKLVLDYEMARESAGQRGRSASGINDLFSRIKQAKEKLLTSATTDRPTVYMVKVDIKKSFDSINQEKLLGILKNILKEEKYTIHQHCSVTPVKGRIVKRFMPNAIASDELPPFVEYARSQAENSKHAILVDKVAHTSQRKSLILNQITEHIRENIVKFENRFYRQTTGIPQGSVLSPALCRLLYDAMEADTLAHLTQSNDSALIRLADDFLFLSRSRGKAAAFLKIMSRGQPKYGCYINENKTIVNFDMSINGRVVHRCAGNDFPFCGLLLHPKTLEIRFDYSRYHGEGRSIAERMKTVIQYACQAPFTDTTFNSVFTVLVNVYQNFVFCAMRFHAYCQELCLDPVSKQHIQPNSLTAAVFEILRASSGFLNSNCGTVQVMANVETATATAAATTNAAGAVTKDGIADRHVYWLGATAFCSTLPSFPIYEPLRVSLQETILNIADRDERQYFKRILQSVVKDKRNHILDGIKYR